MARRLRAEERRKLALDALELAGLGMTNVDIASRLRVNRKTVPGLIEQGAEEAEVDTPLEAAKARAHYRRIIRTCWMRLTDGGLSVNSHNLPALIGQAANAQARLDKLNGVEDPQKVEVGKMSIADFARSVEGVPREQRLRVVD